MHAVVPGAEHTFPPKLQCQDCKQRFIQPREVAATRMHNRKNSRTATLKKKNRRSRRCFCKNPNVLSCLIPLAVALLITVLLSTWRPMSPREGKRLLPRTPHSPPVVLKTLADRWTSSSLCGARPPKLMSKQRNSPPFNIIVIVNV